MINRIQDFSHIEEKHAKARLSQFGEVLYVRTFRFRMTMDVDTKNYPYDAHYPKILLASRY